MEPNLSRYSRISIIMILVSIFWSIPVIIFAQYCYFVDSDGGSGLVRTYSSIEECRGANGCSRQYQDARQWFPDDYTAWCCLEQSVGQSTNTNICMGRSGGPVEIDNFLKCEDIECIVQTIADLITGLVTVIGTIMIIIGGIQYIASAGSEDKARRAKNTVLYAIIGIAIAVSVDFIIGFLREILSSSGN